MEKTGHAGQRGLTLCQPFLVKALYLGAGRKSPSVTVVLQREDVPPRPCYSWDVGAFANCFKPVNNTQMIKGEFFPALDTSLLCVFLHILPVSVLIPQGIPHVLDTWQLGSKLTWTGIVYCWLQCRYSVTSKSACDLRSVFLPLLFYKQSSQDEVMLLWRCQVRGKTAQ